MIVVRCLAVMLVTAAPAMAAAQAVPAPLRAAGVAGAPLADDVLRNLRGKYVPPGAATSPIAVPAGGSVIYFGIAMQTTWHVQGVKPATYAAQAQLGIDLSGVTPTVTMQSATAMSGQAGTAVPAVGAISGSIADGRIAGVAQAVQIAGSGNAATNTATLTLGPARMQPLLVVAPMTQSCGSACSIVAGTGAFGVAIALPGRGTASQTIGAAGVGQQMQIVSNANAVVNSLALQIGTRAAAGNVRGGFGLFTVPAVPNH